MPPEHAGRFGWIGAGRCAEQNAAAFERCTSSAVGEESEMTDAHQATGQNLQQEAAQELMGGNGHDLLLAAVGIVPPAEGDAVVFKSDEPMVGDGHAMGVAGQVVEVMLRPAERRLGVDHPVLAAEFPQELDECVRRGKLLKRAMELDPVLLEEITKPGAELTAEAPAMLHLGNIS